MQAMSVTFATSSIRLSPSPLTPHSSLLTPHSSLLTPHSSLLTPHSSLLTPHPSLFTPHPSPLSPLPSPLSPRPSSLSLSRLPSVHVRSCNSSSLSILIFLSPSLALPFRYRMLSLSRLWQRAPVQPSRRHPCFIAVLLVEASTFRILSFSSSLLFLLITVMDLYYPYILNMSTDRKYSHFEPLQSIFFSTITYVTIIDYKSWRGYEVKKSSYKKSTRVSIVNVSQPKSTPVKERHKNHHGETNSVTKESKEPIIANSFRINVSQQRSTKVNDGQRWHTKVTCGGRRQVSRPSPPSPSILVSSLVFSLIAIE